MVYFAKFPTIEYEFTSKTDTNRFIETGVDVSTRIEMVISDEDFQNMCTRYTIGNGELPEHVSNRFYNTPDLAWTVLYINGIGNINNEWPLRDIELNDYVIKKYGLANINNIHHYEKLPEGIVMDQQFIISNYGADKVNPITNMDYETIKNEYKRLIYVIKPENIGDFVSRYMALL